MPTVYLVSGASRGLGFGIVSQLVARSGVIVFAGARNPESSSKLLELAAAHPGTLHIVKLTSSNEADNRAAIEFIKEIAGRLDVVIANAGILNSFTSVLETPVADLNEHWNVNVLGPHVLFQATYPLLKSSSREDGSPPPKFVVISSGAGSIEYAGMAPGMVAYKVSKAAVNLIAREIHFEHEKDGLVAFSVEPGTIETEGYGVAKERSEFIASASPSSVETTARIILERIDEALRATHGGRFISLDGKTFPW